MGDTQPITSSGSGSTEGKTMRTSNKHYRCRRLVHLTYVILALVLFSSDSIAAAEYAYPYRDPYIATATTAILSDDGATPRVNSEVVHVPGLPGRNKLPSLEGRGDVSIALYRQNRPAPLIFILAGIGSNAYFGVGPYLASLFYKAGNHIVILPSPMSWNFALAASRSGAPGFAPDDARDLYEVMQKSLATVKERYDLKVTAISFMGVSLGALQGAYLSVVDDDERKIGIAKYLLVNPPVDLFYAVRKLDEWNALQNKFGRDKSQAIIARAVAIVESFSEERRDNPEIFDRLAKKFAGFTAEELQFLIAENLQSQLSELVYVTQVLHDQKILSAPKGQMRRRLQEAKSFTFTDYNEKVAVPLWRLHAREPEAALETFINRGSLARILDRLRGNSKVHITHNADDFLAEKKSIEELKEALGDQMTLYPYGGHLGNLWYSENKALALKILRQGP